MFCGLFWSFLNPGLPLGIHHRKKFLKWNQYLNFKHLFPLGQWDDHLLIFLLLDFQTSTPQMDGSPVCNPSLQSHYMTASSHLNDTNCSSYSANTTATTINTNSYSHTEPNAGQFCYGSCFPGYPCCRVPNPPSTYSSLTENHCAHLENVVCSKYFTVLPSHACFLLPRTDLLCIQLSRGKMFWEKLMVAKFLLKLNLLWSKLEKHSLLIYSRYLTKFCETFSLVQFCFTQLYHLASFFGWFCVSVDFVSWNQRK